MYPVIFTYGLILFYFALFFQAVYSSEKTGSGSLKDILCGKGEFGALQSRLIAGIFYLGIGTVHLLSLRPLDPAVFQWPADDGENSYWLFIVGLAVVTGSLNGSQRLYAAGNRPGYLLPVHVMSFLFIRILFLAVYEIFFRGILLLVMVGDLGTLPSVLINIILYVLVHWFNRRERYGSVVMGTLLCSVTLYYHSIWPAVIIHLGLALSSETGMIIKNRSTIKTSII